MDKNPLSALLRPHVEELKKAAAEGNAKATEVINLYRLYYACPRDIVPYVLCFMAFDDWINHANNPVAANSNTKES
jgi:hypothetical protein